MEMFLKVTFLASLTLAKAKIEKGTREGLARITGWYTGNVPLLYERESGELLF